jgi:hypothetical protein
MSDQQAPPWMRPQQPQTQWQSQGQYPQQQPQFVPQQPQLRPVPKGIEPPQAQKKVRASTKKKVILYILLGLMVISTALFIFTAVKYLTQ